MKPITCYGLLCTEKDEKVLAARVNEYLKTVDRTMSKSKNESMLKARLPFVYKYFYWNLNKGVGTYFELFPNKDAEGKYFFEKHADCAWLIKTRINLTHPEYKKEETEAFLTYVLQATGFESVIIYERDEDPK